VRLTTRSKWLTGIAAAVAAWVFFGPRDSDSVEATEGSAQPARHAAPVASGGAAPHVFSGSLQSVARRVADPGAAGALFATHSWYVAPPPPPPPPPAGPVEPPKPVAPPLPYQFLGTYTPDGQPPVYLLSNGDRVYDVHIGDTLDKLYSVDRISNGQLVLTYKPLNIQQQLSLTGVVK
jgi:hypothetical protein